jgi:hypothetical protein
MAEHLPEVIMNAVALLERAFELPPSAEQARAFRNAIYLLNDFKDDVPSYQERVAPIKHSGTLALLRGLETFPENLEYSLWLDYLLLFCIDLKQEIQVLRSQHPDLFVFFLSFINRYEERIVPELVTIIDGFLNELKE